MEGGQWTGGPNLDKHYNRFVHSGVTRYQLMQKGRVMVEMLSCTMQRLYLKGETLPFTLLPNNSKRIFSTSK